MPISPIDAISRLTSSTASGGRRLRISAASSCGRDRSRIADLRVPLSSFDEAIESNAECEVLIALPIPNFLLRSVHPPLHERRGTLGIFLHHAADLVDHLLSADRVVVEFHAVEHLLATTDLASDRFTRMELRW